jgi:hypothetical protein
LGEPTVAARTVPDSRMGCPGSTGSTDWHRTKEEGHREETAGDGGSARQDTQHKQQQLRARACLRTRKHTRKHAQTARARTQTYKQSDSPQSTRKRAHPHRGNAGGSGTTEHTPNGFQGSRGPPRRGRSGCGPTHPTVTTNTTNAAADTAAATTTTATTTAAAAAPGAATSKGTPATA